MAENGKKNQSIDDVVKQIEDAVKPYVEKAKPYIEKAKETAEPYVKEAKDAIQKAGEKAEPTIRKAREKAEPTIKKAREKAEPTIKKAREKAEPMFDEVKTRAAKATATTDVFLQYGDHEMRVDDIVEKAREDYFANGGDKRTLRVLRVYLKPEDHTAYYVANNDETGKVSF